MYFLEIVMVSNYKLMYAVVVCYCLVLFWLCSCYHKLICLKLFF